MQQPDSGVKTPKWWRSQSIQAVILLLSLLEGSAARAQKVEAQFDSSADFGRYKTFAIRNGALNSRNPALNSELIQKQIEPTFAKT